MTLLATITLPGEYRSVPNARRFLRDTLAPDHFAPDDGTLDDIALVVDEFTGNGIRHTASGQGGKITVALLAGPGVLRAEVTDDGANGARPFLREPGDESDVESGRGLHIVDALARRWGHRPDGVRTTVWAEFSTPPRLPTEDS